MQKYQIIIIIGVPWKLRHFVHKLSPPNILNADHSFPKNIKCFFFSFSKKGRKEKNSKLRVQLKAGVTCAGVKQRQFPLVRSQNQSVNLDVMIGDSWLFGWSGLLHVGLRRHFVFLLKQTWNKQILEKHNTTQIRAVWNQFYFFPKFSPI